MCSQIPGSGFSKSCKWPLAHQTHWLWMIWYYLKTLDCQQILMLITFFSRLTKLTGSEWSKFVCDQNFKLSINSNFDKRNWVTKLTSSEWTTIIFQDLKLSMNTSKLSFDGIILVCLLVCFLFCLLDFSFFLCFRQQLSFGGIILVCRHSYHNFPPSKSLSHLGGHMIFMTFYVYCIFL